MKLRFEQLTDLERMQLDMMSRGYALSAAKGHIRKAEREVIESLILRGLVRRTKPAPWCRAGAYVITDAGREIVEEGDSE